MECTWTYSEESKMLNVWEGNKLVVTITDINKGEEVKTFEKVMLLYKNGMLQGETELETLKRKLDKEMSEFEADYANMQPKQVYNDWYLIGFYESYYEMLTGDYAKEHLEDNLTEWLCKLDDTLAYLYDKWTKDNDALNLDCDAMLYFIRGLYEDLD